MYERLVSGYFFNHDADNASLAPLLGRDVSRDSVSWMQAAGGIASTPEDLTRWARLLYTRKLLPPAQQRELLSLVSTKTGNPIADVSAQDPRGFGLGVTKLTMPATGAIWFYEGTTLGNRVVHVYFPRQDAVIAFGLNSQPDGNEDHVGELVTSIYRTLHGAGAL